MEHEIVTNAEQKMDKAIAFLSRDLSTLRAGRANAQVLDRITVNYFGSQVPIQQVGNISSPEPRLLVIAPWDPSSIKEIEKAIQMSDLGINPSNDGKIIRLIFPELTQERRKDLVKVVKKKAEESKVALRAIRRDAIEALKKEKKASTITEDDLKIFEMDMQKLTDRMVKEVDKVCSDKEKEILSL